jgi:type II secretory pathway pseudopilin PulG
MHLEGQGATRAVSHVPSVCLRHPDLRTRTFSACRGRSEAGYAMAALLVSIAIMGILASMAVPVWRQANQREKEAELLFRAGEYARAIAKFRRKMPNAFPPDIDFLINQRYLRKKYKDPMTKDGEWRIVTPAELQGAGVPVPPGATTPGQTGRQGTPSNSGSTATAFGQSQPASPPTSPPGSSTSSFATTSQAGRTVNMGPIAAVASKSTEKSIKIYKGRDRYDQWIVTIDDVAPRHLIGTQQPGQPGQQGRPGTGPQRPSSSSPFSSPGAPTGGPRPSGPTGTPPKP